MKNESYALIDSGNGYKLERFGHYLLARPCPQAVWKPQLPESEWEKADAHFIREEDSGWAKNENLPDAWNIEMSGITLKLSITDFGHLGIFPEHAAFWSWIQDIIGKSVRNDLKILNLFAYSGGSTLAAAKAGAQVCHVDASKGMVAWARENAALNHLDKAPVRWIIDDVSKFLARELRRGVRYDAIILDPPSFGRGARGEIFKIEQDLPVLLENCRALLSEDPVFVLFSCHTPGFSPIVMDKLMHQMMSGVPGKIDSGEMFLMAEKNISQLACGTFSRWTHVS